MNDVTTNTTTSLTDVVLIGAETYSLKEMPKPESSVVKEACADVVGNLNLTELISNLGICRQLIFLARNGIIGGNSAQSDKLIPRITQLHEQFTDLCGKADLALTDISRSSVEIQEEMLSLYDGLFWGDFEGVAETMGRFSLKAGKLATSAHELVVEFDKLKKLASDILKDTQVALGVGTEQHRKLTAQIAELDIQIGAAKRTAEKLKASQKKLEEDYQEAKDKANDAETKAFSMAIIGAIFKPLAAGIGAGVAMYTGGSAMAIKNKLAPAVLPEESTKVSTEQDAAAKKLEAEAAKATADKIGAEEKKIEAELAAEKSKEVELKEKVATLQAAVADKEKAPDGKKAAEGKANSSAEGAKEGKPTTSNAATPGAKEDVAAEPGDAEVKLAVAKADLKDSSAKVVKATKEWNEKKAEHEKAIAFHQEKMKAVNVAIQAAGEAGDKFTKMGDDYQAIATNYRSEVRDIRKYMREQADQEQEALSKVQEFAARMKNAGPEMTGIELACDSLFQAIGALQQVVTILQAATYFWQKMEAACRSMQDTNIGNRISKLGKWPEARRGATLNSNEFKISMLRYYAGWRALEIICKEFSAKASVVRNESAKDYTVNLPMLEARAEAKRLGELLLKNVSSGLLTNEATKKSLQAADAELAKFEAKAGEVAVAEK